VFAVFPHLFYGLAVFKKSKSIKKAALWGVTAFLFFWNRKQPIDFCRLSQFWGLTKG
jgi:hypothetical protein